MSRARTRPGRPERLDPRNPWVLDTRDLPRGAGSMRELTRVVPAPAAFGNDILAVPEGNDITLELSMQSVSEGIWVSGTATALAIGECGRCLEPVRVPSRARFSELYAYNTPEDMLEEDDLDTPEVSPIIEELIDVEPPVRDAMLLGFPLNPLCKAECSGLCSICGVRIDDLDDPEAHTHETIDPRWAALSGLVDQPEEQEER